MTPKDLADMCPFCIKSADGPVWVNVKELENLCAKHKAQMFNGFIGER